jgi:Protein of unknown function (DUF3987)
MPDGPDLRKWEPPSGVLRDYERTWEPTTDAPREYHIAAGLAVIAATVENRVYIPFGGDRIYSNLWVLILGPSSFFRKSSCVNKARKTIGRLQAGSERGPLLPDEFSREALLKHLSERGQGLLTYSEFSGALATFGRDYMSGTKEVLADLYDCPESYTRVIGSATWQLRNVCLSMLAASQTDWFLEKLKAGDVRGGFLARFSYWPAFAKKVFLAVPPEPDGPTFNRLISGLNDLRRVSGQMTILPAVREQYATWLERHERELGRSPRAGDLSAFWSRLSIMTLKFAMLLQVAHNRALVMAPEILASAIHLTEFLKAALRHLFDEEFAFTQDMRDRQKVLRLIRGRPGIVFRDLSRAASMLKKHLIPVLETLRAEEHIELRDQGWWPMSDTSAAVSDMTTDMVRPMISRVK